MRARSASITDLPISPDEDRERRFRMYLYMMLVRVACLGIFFVVPGWWKVLPAIVAVLIPYFAVVVANVSTHAVGEVRQAPNALPPGPSAASGAAGDEGRR
ncbi:DUF3099 domain-containing protein [Agrococcus sp. HG114]|uniref:DUF3099 domain-containing protein n=1 Tax=Agrococcus sp. HG114 TaxID=2969757 RepID=UPI00215A780B|nr:DUF3099 domain-containing protein [Agrococcus sp. HG114]MCR8669684.1 DUF3099 domain-containing protein [Agrococcus sp. HG114]